jgi:hypothetical protein
MIRIYSLTGFVLALAICASAGCARQKQGWEVNDMNRPIPKRITPGDFSTQDHVGAAPSDALVLFDGHDLSHWKAEQGEAKWFVKDGILEINPKSGSILSNESFGDCQLHVEWQTPPDVKGQGQGRGNSGVYVMGRFEVQVLDTYDNRTYADGMAGAIYGQYPPIVNPARPAGQWQIYDIIFRRPRVDSQGKVLKPARMTVLFNGIVVQDDMKLLGPTEPHVLANYPRGFSTSAPVLLQDHGSVVRYRNIWVRNLPEEKEAPPTRPSTETK